MYELQQQAHEIALQISELENRRAAVIKNLDCQARRRTSGARDQWMQSMIERLRMIRNDASELVDEWMVSLVERSVPAHWPTNTYNKHTRDMMGVAISISSDHRLQLEIIGPRVLRKQVRVAIDMSGDKRLALETALAQAAGQAISQLAQQLSARSQVSAVVS